MKRPQIILIFILLILCPIANFSYAQNLKIHFIDVGEGDSILIETPEGKTILIDAGNCITGFRVVEYLKNHNIYSLDHLIFTHPHLDHIGGAFFVLQMLKVRNIYDNGQDLTSQAKHYDLYRWYEDLVRRVKNYKILKSGDKIFLDGVTLDVLWPTQPLSFSDFNTNSLVIMVEYGKFRCLLTGDLTTQGENKLLEGHIDLKADVLKIGHHGAGDASSEEFLRRVSCKIAILSVDKANIRGYPAEEILERLKKARIELYRTDALGDIVLSIYQSKYKEPQIKISKRKDNSK